MTFSGCAFAGDHSRLAVVLQRDSRPTWRFGSPLARVKRRASGTCCRCSGSKAAGPDCARGRCAGLSLTLSTRTLQGVRACLNRSVKRAMGRDKGQTECGRATEVPAGRLGRPSKSLTPEQADGVLTKTKSDRLHAYIVVSLLTGARTEELRALRWDRVHLNPPRVLRTSRSGDRSARMATPRLGDPAARWLCRGCARRRCRFSGCSRPANGWRRGTVD
jgi:hypothetical protein